MSLAIAPCSRPHKQRPIDAPQTKTVCFNIHTLFYALKINDIQMLILF